jgi:signal transduction histidine kinase
MSCFLRWALAAVLASSAWAAEPIDLNHLRHQPLAGHLDILAGRPAETLEEARQAATAGRFQPLPGTVSRGYGNEAVWLRFTAQVPATPAAEVWLEVGPSFLQEVTLFVPQPGGGYAASTAGALQPFALRAIAYRNPVFRLGGPDHPLPGPTATFYLRVRSRTAMVVEPTLWAPQAFSAAKASEGLLFGAFFGVALIIMLANCFYWVRLREPIQLLYAAYLLSMILMFSGTEGYAAQILFPRVGWATALLIPLTLACQPWFAVKLFSALTNLGKLWPRLDKAYRTVGFCLSALAILAALLGRFYAIAPVLNLAIVLLLLGNLGLGFALVACKHRAAWLYLLAFGPYVIGALLRLSRNLAWLPPGFLVEHGLHIGAIFHFCLMNLPLADRLAGIKRERDEVILAAQQAGEEHRQELEHRVDQRTLKLQQAKAQAEAALDQERQVVAEQRQFLSMVSHEFRTPLAVIDGAAQVVDMAAATDPDEVVARAGVIQRSVQRLTHLLDTWLTADRVESGLHGLRLEPIDLAGFLAELIHRKQNTLVERGIRVRLDVLPPTYTCDRDLLGVALQNLLANALKYSPEGSAVEVRGREQDGWLYLEVVDQGCGIPADQMAQIGQRYFRGRNTGGIPGLGLGLHLVQAIATLHGGRLELDSIEGQGTTARLVLPCGT